MSKVITFSWPSSAPSSRDAVTPPDGPLRSSRTGARPACSGVITPPLESRRKILAPSRSSSVAV
jgi:hypothetical protein